MITSNLLFKRRSPEWTGYLCFFEEGGEYDLNISISTGTQKSRMGFVQMIPIAESARFGNYPCG